MPPTPVYTFVVKQHPTTIFTVDLSPEGLAIHGSMTPGISAGLHLELTRLMLTIFSLMTGNGITNISLDRVPPV